MKIEDQIFDMVTPIVESFDFELVDVEYVKEKDSWYLRIYIDKPGGITIDDCQLVSNKVSDLLDEEDPIKNQYILEVSSPGLERVLKKDREFLRYIGEWIELKFYRSIDGNKTIQGVLEAFDDKQLVLTVEGKSTAFQRKDIALAKRMLIL